MRRESISTARSAARYSGVVVWMVMIEVSMTSLTKEALKEIEGLDNKSVTRSKNMFALGMVYWMYDRDMNHTLNFFEQKFKYKPLIAEAR